MPSPFNELLEYMKREIVPALRNGEEFDAEAWLRDWLQRPLPALSGRRASELLDDDPATVRSLLGASLSGAYH